MDRFRDTITALLERIQDGMRSLSSRDRVLLIALSSALLLGLLVGVGMGISSSLRRQRASTEEAEGKLTLAQSLGVDHARYAEQIKEIEARIQAHADTDLQAFLEQASNRVGVSDRLNAVREKSATTDGDLEDKLYTVSLSKLTVDEYAGFLYEVESVGYPLKIRTTRVKRRQRGEEVTLDVDMDISAFRVVKEEG